jgi:hypothetical protein
MIGRHVPERPSWRCHDDSDPWPCELARRQLSETFLDNESALVAHLARLMDVAVRDLGLSDPAVLYRRFVRWAEPGVIRCGRCDSPRHRLLPGVPPRLFPCELGRKR